VTLLIDGALIDASLSETHSRNSEATEFPVESGADLTDHIRALPIELEIEGIVSNTPIGRIALLRDLDGGSGVLPATEALDKLEQIYERRQPVTIQTELKLYERMAMISLSIPKDRETGNVLRFTASFKQIKIITNERTTVRAVTIGSGKRGKIATKPATISPPGSTVVFTLRRVPTGATGGTDIRSNGRLVRYAFKPDWLSGDVGPVVLSSSVGDHFAAGARGRDIADGYVLAGKYTPFAKPVVLPGPGGTIEKDETGRIYHSYPIRDIPTDPNAPILPDNPTNADVFQSIFGVPLIPGQ
jgi:hypothetical protein